VHRGCPPQPPARFIIGVIMDDKEKIKSLEKQIELLEKIIELQGYKYPRDYYIVYPSQPYIPYSPYVPYTYPPITCGVQC
jgi:hypothetical protein